MNIKATLRDYLRRARSDVALRSSMLGDARFSKKLFGWLVLVWVLLMSVQVASEGWRSLGHSTSEWLGLLMAVMLYDKSTDRVAMLEALEEPLP